MMSDCGTNCCDANSATDDTNPEVCADTDVLEIIPRRCSKDASNVNSESPENSNNGQPMEELLNDLNSLLLDSAPDSSPKGKNNSISNGVISAILSNSPVSDGGNTELPNFEKMTKFYEKYSRQCHEIEKLEKENHYYRDLSTMVTKERDAMQQQLKEVSQNHVTKSQEYERRLIDLESQLKVMRDRSVAQETHFRKTLADQHSKMNTQIDQLKRSTEQAHRDKDAAVIKYAQREKELLTMEASVQRSQQQAQQMTIERDALNSRLRAAKNEKQQLVQVVEQKENEISDLKKDLERVKAFIHEADVRVKLGNKRVEEADNAQKEMKAEQEKLHKKLHEAREETETIRAECRRVIRSFQDAADKKTLEIEVQKQEHSDQDEIYRMVFDELEALKRRHKETLIDYEAVKQKVPSIEEELDKLRREVESKVTKINSQNEIIDELRTKLHDLESIKEELSREQKRTRDLECTLSQSQQDLEDCEREAAQCRANAERMLELMEQLTQKNSVVQAEKCALATKLESTEVQNDDLTRRCSYLDSAMAGLEEELRQLKSTTSIELQQNREEIAKKSSKESQLITELEDERNHNQILKRKHAASLKELKSELSLVRRRLEAYESGTASQGSGGSTGGDDAKREFSASRASSYTSLDAAAGTTCHRVGDSPVCGYENTQHPVIAFQSHASGHQQGVCEHNQAMIEKIVKLQRMLARRTEKIEFLEEHAKQLVAELQKKSRLLQMYALRDESGALAPESVDANKLMRLLDQAQLATRGQTIMGSVFSASGPSQVADQQAIMALNDGHLTLDLAMQIIRKLQALFEDTLLKNITLKDNMETLGEEIARISRENRELKLRYETS